MRVAWNNGLKMKPLSEKHKKKISSYPNLRFDLNNGRTLCVPCHKETDTYGFKIRFYGQNNPDSKRP